MAYAHSFGDDLGQAAFAGFSVSDVVAFVGVTPIQASALIKLFGNQPQSAAEQAALASAMPWWKSHPAGPGPYAGQPVWSFIQGQFNHMAQHPKGSHYHGDINVKDLALNIATYGMYGVGKAAVNVAKGGKVIPNLKLAMASTGPGGYVQPIIGTNKTLLLGSLITGGALAKVAAEAGGLTSTLAPPAIKAGTALLNAPAPVPSGLDPRYNPGYTSTPLAQQYNPNVIPMDPTADQGFGPNIGATAEAGMLGGLSPLVLGALFGIPLVLQFFMKGRKK